MRKRNKMVSLFLACLLPASMLLSGCGSQDNSGKIEIELVQYKPEAVGVFEQLEEEFNRTHDNIHLTIDSPNDATTIMKTRFIREDYPDILGIGGDINYSYFIDAGILADVSDYPGMADINQGYRDILEGLEFVPTEGTYGVPYVANAAGILYNREMFKEHGWEIPETWEELIALCEEIQSQGILPFYYGFKDTWTCLAPWNSLAVGLAPADVCQQVNAGKTNFTTEYREVAEKIEQLVAYGEEGPFAYGYNDACTAFANGESAMFAIGSYAVPQIKSVNPDMDIDSFVTPGSSDPDGNTLNSGVDLQFCVTSACVDEGKKEAAYEVLSFLLADENLQMYLDDQSAVPCKMGDFTLAPNLDGMTEYITNGKMADYQDHYYPSEMAVDAQIQTFLIQKDVDAFLAKFDTDWQRYNRDIIKMVQDYNKANGIQ
ncbi:MAG: extracellular solute-binding protein [Lachnospiraceae bacterium]|jgi:raffinose/stachyose/melibiose transport system substrate-binding protein|nr:extracellular solute-binding protein [Lachnospiraceae bacterium]MCI8994351.1 extracellular solute-binding protein [Lachnospiraceae bacterium]MCI9132926.1 extracellular solute-binding protein [Lachnospiraceae bacterium]